MESMNYYSFHIGDYASHTRHLSLLEDLAYRRLIDAYYLSEKPFTGSPASIAKEIGMISEIEEVSYILEKFFESTDYGWINKRCDEEIAKYQGKIEQAIKAGKASAQQRLNKSSTPVQLTNNQEPITINHKPNIKAPAVAKPEGISDITWNDYLTIRKAQKKPITQTALKGLEREAIKAKITLNDALNICCERGWIGFKADWVANLSNPIEKKKQSNWWLTDESVLAKGRELGINARAGESMGQYKQRIQQELDRL